MRTSILALCALAFVGCAERATATDGATVASADRAVAGNEATPAPDAGRACPPDEVGGCGMCAGGPQKFHWDGQRCVLMVFQCNCLGADCARGTSTWRACREAHAACLADPDTRIRWAYAPLCGSVEGGIGVAPLPSEASAPVVEDLGPGEDVSACEMSTLYRCRRCYGPCP